MAIIRDTKDLGAFVRRIRKARGYTQAQLAELAGVGVVYVSHLENGKETAEVGKALHLLQLLSVDLRAIDRQNPNEDALDSDGSTNEQTMQGMPSIPSKDKIPALPALLGAEGKAHITAADQAFWYHPKKHESPGSLREDA